MYIHLVEDNQADILLAKELLEEIDKKIKVSVSEDGEQAIDYFESLVFEGKNELPDLVLMDVNIPKRTGLEVLEYVKATPKLRQVPVVMLSSSNSESDIKTAYRKNCNAYFVKPSDSTEILELLKVVTDFFKLSINIKSL